MGSSRHSWIRLISGARQTSEPAAALRTRATKARLEMKRHTGVVAILAVAALLFGALPALAQVAPSLGAAGQFGVLGNSGVTGSTGAGTIVVGDVGSSPTASITNFPPSTAAPPFTVHFTNDLAVQQARIDADAAYDFLAAQGPGTVLPAQLDGAVLTSGIYSFAGGAADLAAGGTLTLNGPGVFVFQVDSALTANVLSNVVGTADPCNVFWRVGTSATLNGRPSAETSWRMRASRSGTAPTCPANCWRGPARPAQSRWRDPAETRSEDV